MTDDTELAEEVETLAAKDIAEEKPEVKQE